MRGITFEIVGSLESGFVMLDHDSLFMDLNLAQELLEIPGEVTEITLLAGQIDAVEGLLSTVEALVPTGTSAIPWYAHSEMVEYLVVWDSVYIFMYLIIVGLSTFVVINTMIMVINERTREIGMLSALGLSPGQVLRMFLWEGGIIGITGAVIGAIPGSLLLLIGERTGLELYDPASLDAQYFMTPKLYPTFSTSILTYVMILAVLVTLFAVWLPSRTAAKLEPSVALRRNG